MLSNCKEREISFPLLILSQKARSGAVVKLCRFIFYLFFRYLRFTLHFSLSTFFPKSGSTLMKAVTAKVMTHRNMTRMKKAL